MTGWLEWHNPNDDEEPFILHSGGESKFKVDGTALYDDIAVRQAVFECWVAFLKDKRLEQFRLCPIPTGGTVWADGFSDFIKLVGYGSATSSPVIVDDVFTTGASVGEMRNRLGWKTPALLVVGQRTVYSPNTCAWMTVQLP